MLEILLEHSGKFLPIKYLPAPSVIHPANDVLVTRIVEQFIQSVRKDVLFVGRRRLLSSLGLDRDWLGDLHQHNISFVLLFVW